MQRNPGSDAKAAFGAALGIAIVVTLIGNGALAWMSVPVVLCLAWLAMSRAPVRSSLFVLMFLAFTLENPSEAPASGKYKSPLFLLGSVVLEHLNRLTSIKPLFFSGMDIFLVSLGVIAFLRRTQSKPADFAPIPRPMIHLAYLSLAGAVYAWLVGKWRNGDGGIALWQLDRVVYLPCVFLLFQAGLRGPQDFQTIAKVVLWAAAIRSCMAVYVQHAVDLPPDPWTGAPTWLQYATSHHDSMLFAFAAIILIVHMIERIGPHPFRNFFMLMPLLVTGIVFNGRRMAWLQLAISCIALYVVTPQNAAKKKLQKVVKWLSPLGIAYLAAGWYSTAKIFKPVQSIRSAIVSDSNASTAWRDVENVDLIFTIRTHHIFGTGYGHGFYEVVPLPQVEYPLERFIPHNSVLGLWAYTGYFGFTALTLLWVSGVYFAIRAYHASNQARIRAAALTSFSAVLIYWVQCYGDMGLGSWTGVFMIAPALALAGKLATASGAWPAFVPGRRTAPARAAPAAEVPVATRPT
jgi:hypothetical protein